MELEGEGIAALRRFLAANGEALASKPHVKLSGKKEQDSAVTMSVSELREALQGLKKLRGKGTLEVPTLASFVRQKTRVSPPPMGDSTPQRSEKERTALENRRKKLQRLDEDMRYSRLVTNVRRHTDLADFEKGMSSVRTNLSIGTNMVVASVTMFVVCYVASKNLGHSETQRTIWGLVGAILMLLIEMVLFISRAWKAEQLEKQLKKRSQ